MLIYVIIYCLYDPANRSQKRKKRSLFIYWLGLRLFLLVLQLLRTERKRSKFLKAAAQIYRFLKDNQMATVTEMKDHMKKPHSTDNGLEMDRVL